MTPDYYFAISFFIKPSKLIIFLSDSVLPIVNLSQRYDCKAAKLTTLQTVVQVLCRQI